MTRTYTYTLRKAQEERERKRRDAEYERNDLLQYYNGHKAFQQACRAEERTEAESYCLRAALRSHEQALLDSLEKAEKQHAEDKAAAEAAEQEALDKEARTWAAELKLKQRQHVVQESSELKALKQLIDAAKVKVGRDQQLVTKEALASAQQDADNELHQLQEAERAAAVKKDQALQLVRQEKGRAAHKGLAFQLALKDLEEDEAKENLVLERARLDAAAAREGQQDAEVLRARALRQQQERIFIHEYVEQQQSAKLDRALDLAAEEARIEAFQEQQAAREASLAALQAEKRGRAEMRYESIKGQRQAEIEAMEEEQRLIDLLRADDLEQASRQGAHRRRERSEQLRVQMAEANRLQIQLKAEEEAAERREEEKYQEQLMARFAEEDKVEQMNAQKRRLRVEQHKREAARLIAEKQALIAAAKAKEAEALAAAKSREQKLEDIIAEERERMLVEAGPLKQYLPNAVLINKPKLPPLHPAYLD